MAARKDMALKRPGVRKGGVKQPRKSPSGHQRLSEQPGVTRGAAVEEMVRVDHAGEIQYGDDFGGAGIDGFGTDFDIVVRSTGSLTTATARRLACARDCDP